MCVGSPDLAVGGISPTRYKRNALQSYAPNAGPTQQAKSATVAPDWWPTVPSSPGTETPGPTPHETSAVGVGPANIIPPDPTSTDAVQARLRERQQIEQLAGYRGTFLSGPRGPGGPSLAMQREQLRPGTPLPYTTIYPPGYKPPVAVPPEPWHPPFPGLPGTRPPGTPPIQWPEREPGEPPRWYEDVLPAPSKPTAKPITTPAPVNTSDPYITDPVTGVVKRNPDYKSPGWRLPTFPGWATL